MSNWKAYKRSGITLMRPYSPGEDVSGVSISAKDKAGGSPQKGDMIAGNPLAFDDKWLVREKFYQDNFVPLED